MAKDVVDLKNNNYNQVISIVNKYISSIQAISSDISSARSCLSFSVDFSSATSLVSKITSDYTSFNNLIQKSLDKYAQIGEELNREVLKLDFEKLIKIAFKIFSVAFISTVALTLLRIFSFIVELIRGGINTLTKSRISFSKYAVANTALCACPKAICGNILEYPN